MLAEALHTVGDAGIVTVEESALHRPERRLRRGLRVRQRLPLAVPRHPSGQPRSRPRRPVHPAVQREDHQGPAVDAAAGQGDARSPAPRHRRREHRGFGAEHAGPQPRQRRVPVRGDPGPRVRRPAPAQARGHRDHHRRRGLQQALRLHPGDDDDRAAGSGPAGAGHRRPYDDHRRRRFHRQGRLPGRAAASRAGARHVRDRRGGAQRADRVAVGQGRGDQGRRPDQRGARRAAAPGRGRAVSDPGGDGRRHRRRRRGRPDARRPGAGRPGRQGRLRRRRRDRPPGADRADVPDRRECRSSRPGRGRSSRRDGGRRGLRRPGVRTGT